MKIAIEGCCHGELDNIYDTLQHLEQMNGLKVDLLLICGDFQATRNEQDLDSMAVPDKYRQMCTFWKYYAGIKQAPVMTIFIGGNHEASSYLAELPYGGWVAPNIYYLGYAGVVSYGGVRIAGLSGIYKSNDFYKGHYEIAPYNKSSLHSAYHVRNLEVFRLSQIKQPVDIMLSHDWPLGVYKYGNIDQLLRVKPYFREEIDNDALGSPENEKLLKILQPSYWFSAHLHVKFAALYKHDSEKCTKFLSLDKCLPKRQFLQLIDVETRVEGNAELALDPEWLCILKKSDQYLSVSAYNQAPLNENLKIEISEQNLDELKEDFEGKFTVPNNFKKTAPAHEEEGERRSVYLNEQTTLICEMLSIRDPVRVLLEQSGNTSVVSESKTELYNKLLDESDSGDEE